MAPTSFPARSPSSRHFHFFHHHNLRFSHWHQLSQPSPPRDLDSTLQPSVALESLQPPPSSSSGPVVIPPQPSAIPTGNNQGRANPSGDIPGDIIATIVVVVLILGGLVGLAVGGALLRKQTRTRGGSVSPSHWRCTGRRKPKRVENVVGPPRQRGNGKTSTQVACPPPTLNGERRRLSDIWPIRNLSRVLFNRRSCPEQVVSTSRKSSLVLCPQTTWSEFSPVMIYIPTPRTILDCIPEEREEDCQSEANSDIAIMLGRLPTSDSVESPPLRTGRLGFDTDDMLHHLSRTESSVAERRSQHSDSVGSSTPDMTSDGDESSAISLGGLETDKESHAGEVFELRCAQTRSVQMNRGALLSLSFEGRSGAEDSKDGELNLVATGASFSEVSLDELSSPPSALPMIPSFVSGVY